MLQHASCSVGIGVRPVIGASHPNGYCIFGIEHPRTVLEAVQVREVTVNSECSIRP